MKRKNVLARRIGKYVDINKSKQFFPKKKREKETAQAEEDANGHLNKSSIWFCLISN